MPTELRVIPAFSTPISLVNFGDETHELNASLISDIDNERSKTETGMGAFIGNDASWLSDYGLESKYESFKNLQEIITSAAFPAMENSGFSAEYLQNNVCLNNLWANVIFKPGGWAQPHMHGTGDEFWSGVYYPKGDTITNLDYVMKAVSITVQESGALVLADPAKNIKKQVRSADSTEPQAYPYYGANMYIKPTESLLVLFPSWVEHYVTPVIDDVVRYSISFSINKI